MKTMIVELPEEVAAKLENAAGQLGVTPQDLLRVSLEEKLDRLGDDFDSAAKYVLAKNAELYKRLA